mmetsp:Transcript_139298/g.277786  ORF Transcript_139298/g.277786 Transcript_139298/m.277786 type:complete len:218 (+) Transcript_139298:92-745(+)
MLRTSAVLSNIESPDVPTEVGAAAPGGGRDACLAVGAGATSTGAGAAAPGGGAAVACAVLESPTTIATAAGGSARSGTANKVPVANNGSPAAAGVKDWGVPPTEAASRTSRKCDCRWTSRAEHASHASCRLAADAAGTALSGSLRGVITDAFGVPNPNGVVPGSRAGNPGEFSDMPCAASPPSFTFATTAFRNSASTNLINASRLLGFRVSRSNWIS